MSNQYLRYVFAYIQNQSNSIMVLESEIPNQYTWDSNSNKVDSTLGCHIHFDIQAALSTQPKTIHFTSFNPSDQQLKFSQQEGNMLVVYAGYLGLPSPQPVVALDPKSGFYSEAQISQLLSDHLTSLSQAFPSMSVKPIFMGNIIQARKLLANTTDSVLEITAVDGDVQMTTAFTNISVKAGQTSKSTMEAATAAALNDLRRLQNTGITAMPFVLNYEENQGVLHRGKTIVSPYYDALRAFGANNSADVYFEDGSPTVLGRDSINGPLIEISPSSGLIGLPTQTFNGINVRCTLNASLVRGGGIKLNNKLIQVQALGTGLGEFKDYVVNITPILDGIVGNYKILAVNHVGDTRGQDWYTDLICYSYDTPPPSSIGKYTPF